jgi:hypothetical protein
MVPWLFIGSEVAVARPCFSEDKINLALAPLGMDPSSDREKSARLHHHK